MLTKDAILATVLKCQTVTVPEWGGDVQLRELSGADRDAWEQKNYEARKSGATPQNIRAGLVCLCLVDEGGKRLFCDGEIEALGKLSGAALDRLFDVCLTMNRLRADDVEDARKN